MDTKKVLATIKVAGQIASVIGATKVVAGALQAGYQWYNTPEEEHKSSSQDQNEDSEQDDGVDKLNIDSDHLICPITNQPIMVPASTRYGNLFELSAIEQYVRKYQKCPLSQRKLSQEEIFPQYDLKKQLERQKFLELERIELQASLKQLSNRAKIGRKRQHRNHPANASHLTLQPYMRGSSTSVRPHQTQQPVSGNVSMAGFSRNLSNLSSSTWFSNEDDIATAPKTSVRTFVRFI